MSLLGIYGKRYGLVIFLIATYWGIKFFATPLIPDLLGLSEVSAANYFGTIASCTASIFGILIAVVLLTFEMVKDSSLRRKEKSIFNHKGVNAIVSLAICVEGLAILGLANVHSLTSCNDLSIAYFIGFLFILFILSIFPATENILESTDTLQEVKKEINSLILGDFKRAFEMNYDKFIYKDSKLKLVRIRQQLMAAIESSDHEAYTVILADLNEKALQLLGNESERRVLDGIVFVWNGGIATALRKENYQFYDLIWGCTERLYGYAARQKYPLQYFHDIEFFIMNFTDFLFRNKLSDSLIVGVRTLLDCFKLCLKSNCPPQESISGLYYMFRDTEAMPTHNYEEEAQWEGILQLLSRVASIHTSSVEAGDKELFEQCNFQLEILVREIIRPTEFTLGKYQEAFIVLEIILNQVYVGNKAARDKLIPNILTTYKIDASLIAEIAKAEKFYLGRIMQELSDFIIRSQRERHLDANFQLNYWVAIARHLAKYYLVNKTAHRTIVYVVDTLEKMKMDIESNQLAIESANYLETRKQIESIKYWLVNENQGKEIDIITRLETLISSFKEVSGNKDFKIVKWETE